MEWVPGPDDRLCSYYTYLDEEGTPLFHFTKRIIRRFPVGMGNACYHVTDWNPEVRDEALKLFRWVGLRGLANAEFKRDERDGRLKLIECNARFTASDCLVARSGFDLAAFVYNRAVGLPQRPLESYAQGMRLWDPVRDFECFLALRKRGELTFGQWAASVLRRHNLPLLRVVRPAAGVGAGVQATQEPLEPDLIPARGLRTGLVGGATVPNILIMPTPLRQAAPGRASGLLGEAGFTPIDPPGTSKLSAADLSTALPESDALLAWGGPLTAAMMDRAPRLRVIARTGAGYDAVDLDAATARRIAVTVTPGANAESVAEQTFALLLALARNVVGNDRSIRRGAWDRGQTVRPLRGTTLGVVGLGRCGRAVAGRALAFGMRVVACSSRTEDAFGTGVVRLPLDELLARSDAVSLHLPLSASTRGLFDRHVFAKMRPGALFLNTARGALVVEADLVESLTSGHLAGAGLDVQAAEPPRPDNPLLALPNVVFSPHIGGVDAAALDSMAEQAARSVIDLYHQRWPEGCVVERKAARRAGGWS